MKKLIFFVIIFLFCNSSMCMAAEKPAAYKLNNGYIAVREDVFNVLVQNDMLLPEYKTELERAYAVITALNDAHEAKDINHAKEITTLEEIIAKKDLQLDEKDNISAGYESLYKSVKAENTELRRKASTYKIVSGVLAVGLITSITK